MVATALPLFPALTQENTRLALRIAERTLDYAGLSVEARAFALRLRALGIEPGQRVLVWAHHDLESLIALAAAVISGAVLIPINPGVGDQELAHVIADAAPAAVFSARVAIDAPRTPGLSVHDLARARGAPSTPSDAGSGANDPEAPCLVLYTSGTTGAPKGALLCARNIAATLDGLRDAWQLESRDTIVHALPLFHAHGLVFGLFGALRVGACLEHVPKFSPQAIATALAGESRVLYAVPTMYHRLADAAERDAGVRSALAGARLLVSGSAALPAREHARIEALTGQRVCERYGLSETLINTAVRADRERRAGYVGEPLPGVEIKLVDEARKPVEARDDASFGELAVRGPNVFLGYLNRPDATAAVLDSEGWFFTGDLACWSADGYLRIVGRKATDLIKSGGFKVGAGEIEGALLEHPDVREVAVIGVPDEDLGERIVAYVVARDPTAPPDAEALSEFVALALARHKRPRELRFVAELPRNALGKVQKAKLK
jgi:malonyl-CoA/methylmalonyl-CoA synthetase